MTQIYVDESRYPRCAARKIDSDVFECLNAVVFMQQFPPAGIRDADDPDALQLGNPSECSAVEFEALPLANSDLVFPVRG